MSAVQAKVETLFPQLVGDYRIQTLKCFQLVAPIDGLLSLLHDRSSSRPAMPALWSPAKNCNVSMSMFVD